MFGLSNKSLIIAGVVAALIGTGAVASRMYERSVEDRVDFATYMITKKLELNDSQEASLDKLAEKWVTSASTMKDFRKSVVEELKGMTNGEDLSEAQLVALRDKINNEIKAKTDAMIPELVTFYNGLDKDQRAKITDRIDRMSKRIEEGRHGHGRRHHKRHGGDWD